MHICLDNVCKCFYMKHTCEDCRFSYFFKCLYHFRLLFYRKWCSIFPYQKNFLQVNAVNIRWNTRQYINTSRISSMFSRYFFFQIIVSNINSVNLIICCSYEKKKIYYAVWFKTSPFSCWYFPLDVNTKLDVQRR